MKIAAIIPARAGSKGIPRKNLRMMNSKPLIYYSINSIQNSMNNIDIYLTSDDDELLSVGELYGARPIKRDLSLSTDKITLDPVIFNAVESIEKIYSQIYDIVITVQPTSPLLTSNTLDLAIDKFINENNDTVISVVNRPHLSWNEFNHEIVPSYTERKNRQDLPKHYIETGAFVITKREYITTSSRFGNKISVYEVPEKESIDIDSPEDWWVAEKILKMKKIILRTDGYSEIGMGHIYRCLQLAYNMIDHDILFILSSKSDIGKIKVESSNFRYQVIENDSELIDIIVNNGYDIIVNDILDTDTKYITSLKETGIRVVNLEDLGSGSIIADAVINDLYESQHSQKNTYWGHEYYCIRDEFLLAEPTNHRDAVENILVLFGGTDPSNLTQKLLEIAQKDSLKSIKFTFVLGIGYNKNHILNNKYPENIEIISDVKTMVPYMKKADLAISSQGRTMFELASLAIPTVLLAQNKRELHHNFGYLQNGFINLGLGIDVDEGTIYETIRWLVNSPQLRLEMKQQMMKFDLKNGLNRVLKIILNE